MADVFVRFDRGQSFLMDFNFGDLLGEDHLVWTVIDVIDSLDLTPLYARYGDHPEGGRPAFDPKMMLALLVYGYADGLRSSRQLERACRLDFAYRAITANLEPDHATIARFRVSLDDQLASLFAQVLGICREMGMGKVGLVAVDGTKIEAAASKSSNRNSGQLTALEGKAKAILAEAEAADRAETEAATAAVGRGAAERLGKIGEAKARLQAKTPPARGGDSQKEPTVNLTDPDSRMMKRPDGGFLQGYNAQAVATPDQLVVAATVSTDPGDVRLLEPMLAAAAANLAAAGIDTPIGIALADAGYWSEANSKIDLGIDLLIATTKSHRVGKDPEPVNPPTDRPPSLQERAQTRRPVIDQAAAGVITLTEAATILGLSYSRTSYLINDYQRRGDPALELQRQPNRFGPSPQPPSSATLARREMETKLAQPENLHRYRQRGWMIEGIFAHTKTHRGYRRFLRRGLPAVDAEWKLIHLAANIRKTHRHTNQPTPGSQPTPKHHHPPKRHNRHQNRCHLHTGS